MLSLGITDLGFLRLAQALPLAEDQERIQNPEIEIFWDEGDDPRSGGWVWHFKSSGGLVHPIGGDVGKNPVAEEEDLKFEASLDPDFPGGDIRLTIDPDNVPYRGLPW